MRRSGFGARALAAQLSAFAVGPTEEYGARCQMTVADGDLHGGMARCSWPVRMPNRTRRAGLEAGNRLKRRPAMEQRSGLDK